MSNAETPKTPEQLVKEYDAAQERKLLFSNPQTVDDLLNPSRREYGTKYVERNPYTGALGINFEKFDRAQMNEYIVARLEQASQRHDALKHRIAEKASVYRDRENQLLLKNMSEELTRRYNQHIDALASLAPNVVAVSPTDLSVTPLTRKIGMRVVSNGASPAQQLLFTGTFDRLFDEYEKMLSDTDRLFASKVFDMKNRTTVQVQAFATLQRSIASAETDDALKQSMLRGEGEPNAPGGQLRMLRSSAIAQIDTELAFTKQYTETFPEAKNRLLYLQWLKTRLFEHEAELIRDPGKKEDLVAACQEEMAALQKFADPLKSQHRQRELVALQVWASRDFSIPSPREGRRMAAERLARAQAAADAVGPIKPISAPSFRTTRGQPNIDRAPTPPPSLGEAVPPATPAADQLSKMAGATMVNSMLKNLSWASPDQSKTEPKLTAEIDATSGLGDSLLDIVNRYLVAKRTPRDGPRIRIAFSVTRTPDNRYIFHYDSHMIRKVFYLNPPLIKRIENVLDEEFPMKDKASKWWQSEVLTLSEAQALLHNLEINFRTRLKS